VNDLASDTSAIKCPRYYGDTVTKMTYSASYSDISNIQGFYMEKETDLGVSTKLDLPYTTFE